MTVQSISSCTCHLLVLSYFTLGERNVNSSHCWVLSYLCKHRRSRGVFLFDHSDTYLLLIMLCFSHHWISYYHASKWSVIFIGSACAKDLSVCFLNMFGHYEWQIFKIYFFVLTLWILLDILTYYVDIRGTHISVSQNRYSIASPHQTTYQSGTFSKGDKSFSLCHEEYALLESIQRAVFYLCIRVDENNVMALPGWMKVQPYVSLFVVDEQSQPSGRAIPFFLLNSKHDFFARAIEERREHSS